MELGQNIALAIIEAFVYFLFHLDNSGFKATFLMKKLNLDSNFMASSTSFQKGQVNGFPSLISLLLSTFINGTSHTYN